jgi:Tfp pilus assembly protein PilO
MPRPDERQALIITVIVVVLAVVAIGAGLFFTYRELGQLNEENANLDAKITDAQNKVNKIPDLKKQVSILLADLVLYEEILPDEKEIENIQDLFNDFKKEASIEIVSVRPKAVRTSMRPVQANYDQHTYDLKLVGTYYQFMKFVNLLETHNRFIKVDTFEIRQKDPDSLISDIALTISTFSFKAPAAAPVRPAPAAGVAR